MTISLWVRELLFMEGLKAVFSRFGWEVVAASTAEQPGQEFSEAADVVILQVSNCFGQSWSQEVAKLRAVNSAAPVILLTLSAEHPFEESRLKTLGVRGILLMSTTPEFLKTVAEAACSNTESAVYSPGVVVKGLDKTGPFVWRFKQLTPRQREILKKLAEGMSVKQIAFALKISVSTVEWHKRNLTRKLNIQSRAQLVTYAAEEGIIKLPNTPGSS